MTGGSGRLKYVLASAVLVIMVAASVPVALGVHDSIPEMQRAHQWDPTLPSSSDYDFSAYYRIHADGVDQDIHGALDRTISCPTEWAHTVAATLTLSQEFVQGYLFKFNDKKVRILYQRDGVRETHDFVCVGGTVVAMGHGTAPATSCGDDVSENGNRWKLVPETFREGLAEGDSNERPVGTRDLTKYDELCLHVHPSSSGVKFTGRLKLIVRNVPEPSEWSTWPNFFAGQRAPDNYPIFDAPPELYPGHALWQRSDAELFYAVVPVHVTFNVNLPVDGLGGVGNWEAEVYGKCKPMVQC